MKKILAILRVSTEKQELESQKLELGTYLKTKGFQDKEIQWLEAKGASARMVKRLVATPETIPVIIALKLCFSSSTCS